MLFTSLAFFVFLPAVLAVFAATPARHRWLVLLAASLVFYGYARPSHLAYLAAVMAVAIACARLLERTPGLAGRRWTLGAGLALILGSLPFARIHDFPAGYSFYAFSAAAFVIDTFRRDLAPAPAAHAALYLAWFPKVLAGPIERATTFLPRLAERLEATPGQVVLGSQLVLWGLVKKVVVADNLAPVVDRAFGIAQYASPVELLVSVYFFAFQIYCDFSGYTDIALGVSLLFGLPLMENFRRPYLARGPGEFWSERWHISLGRWFRDYLYVPLGGSRAAAWRTYLNLMIVFVASGLWHAGLGYGTLGWTFVAWGAVNGLYLWGSVATRPLWSALGGRFPRLGTSGGVAVLRIVLTFHLIAASWILFRAKSLQEAWTVARKIGAAAADLPMLLAKYPFTAEHYTGFALIAALVAVEIADERRSIFRRLAAAPVAVRWGACYGALFALLLLGRWQAREFIYMQF